MDYNDCGHQLTIQSKCSLNSVYHQFWALLKSKWQHLKLYCQVLSTQLENKLRVSAWIYVKNGSFHFHVENKAIRLNKLKTGGTPSTTQSHPPPPYIGKCTLKLAWADRLENSGENDSKSPRLLFKTNQGSCQTMMRMCSFDWRGRFKHDGIKH